jgi:Fe-Mn family superoxide dismutase
MAEPKFLRSPKGLEPCFSPEALHSHVHEHYLSHLRATNKLCEGTEFEDMTLEEVVIASQKEAAFTLHNHAAQAWNHEFFWASMREEGGPPPSQELIQRFELHFGGLEKFKEKFAAHVMAQFGSGWVWLVDKDAHLQIINLPNAGAILTQPIYHPILVIDAWEHAHYLDYREDKLKYVSNWWAVVDWEVVERRLREADERNGWLHANQALKSFPSPISQ